MPDETSSMDEPNEFWNITRVQDETMTIPASLQFKDFAFGFLRLFDENDRPLNTAEHPPTLSLGFKAKGIADESGDTEFTLTGILNDEKETVRQLIWQGLNALVSEGSANMIMHMVIGVQEQEEENGIPTNVELQAEIATFTEALTQEDTNE